MLELIEKFVKFKILSNIVIAVTIIAGIVSILNTKRSFFPETKPRNITIQVVYPGASPEELEEGVTLKVEEAIKSIPGIDEVNSTSSENMASIQIKTLKGYDLDDIYTETKNAVDRINSFPLGAERPTIYKEKPRSTAMFLGLTGDKTDLFELKKYAEEIEDDLLASGVISQVNVSGFPNLEISIEVTEENLSRYSLSFDQVANVVRQNNRDISAGSIKGSSEEVLIRSRAKETSAEKIGEIILRANNGGSYLLLRDVATITEKFEDVPVRALLNGKESVSIRIDKLPEEDLVEISDFASEYVVKFDEKHPSLHLEVTYDFMDMLTQRLSMLISNGGFGLILVVIALGLFLSVRLSFWVAWGIPSSFLGMFFFAQFIGITINMISLFGMILVVGILVDDGIVIAENIYAHFEKGKNPYRAAVDGTMEVMSAVFTSVSTTIVAFIPILLLDGGMEFLFEMAIVVILSLVFSLLEAFLVLPAHLASEHVLRSKNKTSKIRNALNGAINYLKINIYGKALTFTIKHKWISITAVTALFPITIGLLGGGVIKATFFPQIPFSSININVEFKAGTRESIVEKTIASFEKDIWELNEELKKEHKDTVNFINYTFSNLGFSTDGSGSGSHVGSINVFHRELEGDPIDGFQLNNLLREKIGKVPEAEKLTVGGGNSRWGKPVSIRLMGKDFEELTNAKNFLKGKLNEISDLNEITDNITVGKRELQVELTSQAYFLGLTHNEIVKQIRQGFFGEEVQRLQKGKDEVKVWVRYPEVGRRNVGQLDEMKVKYSGNEYGLDEMVDYEVSRGVADIRHYNAARTVTVEADLVDPYGEVPPILSKIENDIVPEINALYPTVKVDYGGQAEESAKSRKELMTYFGGAFFVMFLLIMLNFKSFYQAVLIMAMIPLGWLGAILGHGIQGIPVSILSAWGMIALSGVIINDAVVFLDKYNRNLRDGMKVYDAAFDAGISRFRPILLTSITTVCGLFPLLVEGSFQAQFLIPMACSIAFGVLIGTFIILLFFPVLIILFNDIRQGTTWLWTGEKPEPEAVERVIIDQEKEELLV
ncbi:MAG: efflux RND transporter permease subunit [Flammeovirgaceae bacterium]|nr:efflux RND transporter permease subunit [Flammeovirgaceae bacterium]